MSELTEVIYGVNPVKEAIRAGMEMERVYLSKKQGPAAALAMQLRDAGVPVIDANEQRMQHICAREDGREANHQGIAVVPAAASYCGVEDILSYAQERGETPLIVLLDGVTDPNNLGAIIRSTEALGAHGIILPKRRSAGLSAAAFRASAGAAAHCRIARVANLAAQIGELKKQGFWIAGTAAGAPSCWQTRLTGPLAICIGSEGEGLSRIVTEKCDFMVGIPLQGSVESLNAACAASILLYEIVRQRSEGNI